jgi:hypothetical protein
MSQAYKATHLVKELVSFFLCCEGVEYLDGNLCLAPQVLGKVDLTKASTSKPVQQLIIINALACAISCHQLLFPLFCILHGWGKPSHYYTT